MNRKKSIISVFVILLLTLLIVVVYILTKDNNKLSVVKGVWLADKTQYVYIIKYENEDLDKEFKLKFEKIVLENGEVVFNQI